MRKLSIIAFVIFFVSVLDAKSQSRFRDGYIVTLKNDTIRGHIENRLESLSYKSCYFKKDNVNKKYLPHQILEYGSGTEKCYSSTIVKGRFVEVLIKGEISLYKYRDVYYVKKEGDVYKLEFIEYEVQTERGASIGVREDNKWRGILTYLISDCFPKASKITENLSFNERELTNLILRYNNCKNSDIKVYKTNLPWKKINYGGTIGVARSLIDVKDSYAWMEGSSEFCNSYYPMLGLAVEAFAPRLSDRVALQAEINFSKPSCSFIKYAKNNVHSYKTDVNYTTISFPISIKYYLQKRRYSPYIEAGLNFNSVSTEVVKLYSRNQINAEDFIVQNKEDIDSEKYGFWGGIGISRSFSKFKIGANIRYYVFDHDMGDALFGSYNIVAFSIVIFRR